MSTAELAKGVQRRDVSIPVGPERLAAWWYPPAGERAKAPCVVMAHGFAAIKEMRLGAHAERFAEAGFGALVFDYRHFGQSTGEPRNLLDPRVQQEDWRAAVAYARDLPEVDPARVALWGTSFAGGQVVIAAAADPDVAAVVAQVPMADGRAALAATPPLHALRLSWAGVLDELGARLGLRPRTLRAVGEPGDRDAVMTSPDAYPAMQRMVPAGVRFDNEVCARIALRVGLIRPVRSAPRFACPLLVQVMDRDVVTPPAPAAEMAARAPHGELIAYHGGHFDAYDGELFERVVGDQLGFLARHLTTAEAAR